MTVLASISASNDPDKFSRGFCVEMCVLVIRYVCGSRGSNIISLVHHYGTGNVALFVGVSCQLPHPASRARGNCSPVS